MQERGCYAFCFSGPQEVREVQLNQDLDSINNLLDFLESRFNGGSDFNEPIRRCLARLSVSPLPLAAWHPLTAAPAKGALHPSSNTAACLF